LRLSSEVFWDLTFEELDALVEHHNEQQKRWDLRFGVVAAAYINCKLKEGAEPIKPGAFFGYDTEEDDYEMTPEETVLAIKSAMAKPRPKVTRERIQQ
jgi:hypothetical protein